MEEDADDKALSVPVPFHRERREKVRKENEICLESGFKVI